MEQDKFAGGKGPVQQGVASRTALAFRGGEGGDGRIRAPLHA